MIDCNAEFQLSLRHALVQHEYISLRLHIACVYLFVILKNFFLLSKYLRAQEDAIREATILRSISHKNIVKYVDSGMLDGKVPQPA